MATGVAFGDTTENAILNLMLRIQTWPGYADNTVTSAQTNIAFALHTADPTDSGTQASNEVTTGQYQNYARVNQARSTSGFTAPAGGSSNLNSAVTFAAAGAASSGATVNNFSTGSTGTTPAIGTILMYGALSPTVTIANGVTPQLTTATSFSID